MNSFEIMLNHRELHEFTQQNYLALEQNLKSNKTATLNQYIIKQKFSQTQWTASYFAINSKTRQSHVIQVYRISLLVEEEKATEVQRLRKLSRKMMKMNPEFVMKCFQCLENQHFILMVMEASKEKTLAEVLNQGKFIKEKLAVDWIKQIIRGIAELYKQNIYLAQVDPYKICLVDEQSKLNDFINIERRLILTEADIVTKHIREIAKIFLVMVTGKEYLNQQKNITTFGQLFQEYCIKLSYLSDSAKDFLISALATSKNSILTWQQLIHHKLFIDQTRRSSNEEFLKLAQIHPEIPLKKKQSSLGTSTVSVMKQSKSLSFHVENWDCEQYVEIQKVKLILQKIIHDIAEDKVFDTNGRQMIEILYLMAVRCLNNLNHLNSAKEKYPDSQLIKHLKNEIQQLEKRVTKTFYQYSSLLTSKQNQKLQVGRDWLNLAKSIVKLKFFESQRRNKFLTGIQTTSDHSHDYTKQEQIDFTQELITAFLAKCKFHYSERDHVFYYLSNYKRIMDIKVGELESVMFGQKVKEILLEESDEAQN